MSARILLAAPDPRALLFHQAFLTRQGYEVAFCSDGLDCSRRLRHDPPDLLVLALELPWGRGEGVLALMADGELPPVPVILIAETTTPPRLAADSPVRSFVPWPAPPRLLAQSVRAVLAASAGHAAPERDMADDWSATPLRPWA
jgi:DNA-binding response OmpR family regulator